MAIAVADRSGHWKRLRTAGSAIAAVVAPAAALAHVDHEADAASTAGWNVTPDILIASLLVAAVYAAGLWRQRSKGSTASPWKHVNFFCGLAAVFIALQSPLDALANHLFSMHQVQHLLLQTVAPIFLMLSAPQGLLVAGMPAAVQRYVLRPVMSSRAVRRVFGFLVRPWIAAFLLVASLYVWHWPPYHDRAVLDDTVHYLMHVTMLAAGLLFYWHVFDPRPPPQGAGYGTRWNILLFTMTAGMLLGAAIALKDTALYTAYDRAGRLWELSPLTDERIGGLIMWIPGSMLCVPAFLVILRMWNSRESRLDGHRRRGVAPVMPAVRAGNLEFALRLAAIALAAFGATIGVALITTGQRF